MSVYPVREDTLLVKRNLEEKELEEVKFLEIGVGNAELSIAAAKKGAEVTAVDIDKKAVNHARERFKEKDLEAKIFHSNLFEKVEGNFDLIVFNPPYLSGEHGIGDENTWRGGETGLETAEDYLNGVKNYLSHEREAWIVLSSHTDQNKLVENFGLEEIDREKLWFETIFLYKLE